MTAFPDKLPSPVINTVVGLQKHRLASLAAASPAALIYLHVASQLEAPAGGHRPCDMCGWWNGALLHIIYRVRTCFQRRTPPPSSSAPALRFPQLTKRWDQGLHQVLVEVSVQAGRCPLVGVEDCVERERGEEEEEV